MSIICCVFPAFGIEYTEKDIKLIKNYSRELDKYLEKTSNIVNLNKDDFFSIKHDLQFNELKAQYIAYIFSCIISDKLKEKNIIPGYISSYSLGIYAALYYSCSITFEEGLRIIQKVYELTTISLNKKQFGMAGIIGLKYDDLKNIINSFNNVEIVNCNNEHSFIISGLSDEVDQVIESAKSEGALNTRLLPIKAPYHSKFMSEPDINLIPFLKSINIKPSKYKFISCIDQTVIDKKEEIEYELIKNISTNFNWFKTMKKNIELGVDTFIECGHGKSLYKNSKFIEGEYKFYTSGLIDEMSII